MDLQSEMSEPPTPMARFTHCPRNHSDSGKQKVAAKLTQVPLSPEGLGDKRESIQGRINHGLNLVSAQTHGTVLKLKAGPR